MRGSPSVPVCDLLNSATHAAGFFQTGVVDQASKFTLPVLLLLNVFARPNVTPTSCSMRNGSLQSPLSENPFTHNSRCCSRLVSLCWMNAASSFNASRCSTDAPPTFVSTKSSSENDHPGLPLASRITCPGGLRSITAGSKSCTSGRLPRVFHGSEEQPRQVTRTG